MVLISNFALFQGKILRQILALLIFSFLLDIKNGFYKTIGCLSFSDLKKQILFTSNLFITLNFIKKTIAIAGIFTCFSTLNQAQPEKGARTLGGLLKVENTENDAGGNSKDAFSVELSPSYSVFITEKLAIGGRLGYDYSNNYTASSIKTLTSQTHSVPISLFLQYYHWFTPQAALTIRGGVNYRLGFIGDKTYTIASQQDTLVSSTSRSTRLFISPSILWMPDKHWGLELNAIGVEYGNDARLDKDGTAYSTTNAFRLNLSSAVGLGLYYYF